MPAFSFRQVKQRKWNIFVITRQRFGSALADFFGCLRIRQSRTQVTQDRDSTLRNHFLRDLMDRRQNSPNPAYSRLVRNWTIRDCKMRLFREPVPMNLQQDIFVPRRRPAAKRPIHQWPDYMPNL